VRRQQARDPHVALLLELGAERLPVEGVHSRANALARVGGGHDPSVDDLPAPRKTAATATSGSG
jgi:hypothetical protein